MHGRERLPPGLPGAEPGVRHSDGTDIHFITDELKNVLLDVQGYTFLADCTEHVNSYRISTSVDRRA